MGLALVGSVDAPPKLASYAGKGPLAGWLGVAAQRIALMIERHEGGGKRAADAAGPRRGWSPPIRSWPFIKGHLRARSSAPSARRCCRSDDRERMVYRMHIIDGLTVERIAKTYGVSHSTVSRWMAAARAGIVAEAQRLLRDEMQASPGDYESMSRLLVSQLDLSVSRLLGKLP